MNTKQPYVIVRTYSAGVHAGFLESLEGKQAVLRDARRIWWWTGAASLSQLAAEGTSKPKDCKFSVPTQRITLTEAIEVIETSAEIPEGRLSVQEVPAWKA